MSVMHSLSNTVTPPAYSKETGVHVATIRRAIDRLGLGTRIGQYRVLARDELPTLRAELLRVGALVDDGSDALAAAR